MKFEMASSEAVIIHAVRKYVAVGPYSFWIVTYIFPVQVCECVYVCECVCMCERAHVLRDVRWYKKLKCHDCADEIHLLLY